MEGRQLFSVGEVGERWGVSTFTVRRLIDSGEIRSITIGARRLIPIAEIERCELAGAGTPRRRRTKLGAR